MPVPLIRRYTYGNYVDGSTIASPEADFLLGMPARQRELITLAKLQIEVQRETASELARSNTAAAELIRRELDIQTETLQAAIGAGSEKVATAVSVVGDRLAGELIEIRWELAQINLLSEQIITILRRPRSIEAQELLAQGASNLANNKLEAAEERFRRALALDNTDYQVLMNLSAVELRKDNAERAIEYAQDALTLPLNLDADSRANGLWHLARIHYAKESFSVAYDYAKQSISVGRLSRRVFQTGVYAILADHRREGLALILDAVRSEPELFALAVSTPDLKNSRQEVVELLGDLADEAAGAIRISLADLRARTAGLWHLTGLGATYVAQLNDIIDSLEEPIRAPAYTEARRLLPRLEALEELPMGIRALAEAETQVALTATAAARARNRSEQAHQINRALTFPGCVASAVGVIGYIVVFNLSFERTVARGGDAGLLVLATPILIGIPMFLILKLLQMLSDRQYAKATILSSDAQYQTEAAKRQFDALSETVSSVLQGAA